MPLNVAKLEPKPESRDHVRRAIEGMIRDARRLDPQLPRYELYESIDAPNTFLVQQVVSAVDDRLGDREAERLMELGTALSEELRRPIEIERLRLVMGNESA